MEKVKYDVQRNKNNLKKRTLFSSFLNCFCFPTVVACDFCVGGDSKMCFLLVRCVQFGSLN